jgi:hypothetical protein
VQRWNWFLAADVSGKWITTNGYAEVASSPASLEATLRYYDVAAPYQYVSALIDANGQVSATVTSPSSDIAPFRLAGQVFAKSGESILPATMMLLTDGRTVLGLTFGPNSHQDNL